MGNRNTSYFKYLATLSFSQSNCADKALFRTRHRRMSPPHVEDIPPVVQWPPPIKLLTLLAIWYPHQARIFQFSPSECLLVNCRTTRICGRNGWSPRVL